MRNKERREIIHIDEDLCDGCGLCVPACAEKAIEISNGKARLISETFCDGLGACLGDCPQRAISIVNREADSYDHTAVEVHIRSQEEGPGDSCFSCSELLKEKGERRGREGGEDTAVSSSALGHWPVQLQLVSPGSGFLRNPQLLIAADCVPFALADFHQRFLTGKALLIGCPKLDDTSYYYEKLRDIFKRNAYKRITVLMMEVPCCSGLSHLVAGALKEAGRDAIQEDIIITRTGEICQI